LKHGIEHSRLWIEVNDTFSKRLAGRASRYAVNGPFTIPAARTHRNIVATTATECKQ
jgi:hypothetical protein